MKYLILSLGILSFCCNQQKDNILETTLKEKPVTFEYLNQDSIRIDKALKETLSIAKDSIWVEDYTQKFRDEYKYDEDFLFWIETESKIGHLISNKHKHLLIKQIAVSGVFIRLYLIEDNLFKPVLSREISLNSYTGDTLKDVNGDGLNDLLIHWYPSSSCCTAYMCDVALSQSEKGDFITDDFEFINVNFSPKDKIIRGGRDGYYSEYHTYQWNDFKVDTLAITLVNHPNETPRLYTTTKYQNNKPVGKPQISNLPPKEYDNLEIEGEE